MTNGGPDKAPDNSEEMGRQLILALRSVTDGNAIMQAIADRVAASQDREWSVRIDGIEKSIEVAHDDAERFPTKVQEAVSSLKSLLEIEIAANTLRVDSLGQLIEAEIKGDKQFYIEKFRALAETLRVLEETVDARFVQNDKNTEKAFDAAEKAVYERDSANSKAADKSEKNLLEAVSKINDTIKTLSEFTGAQINTNKQNTDEKIIGVTERLSRVENLKAGGSASLAVGLGIFSAVGTAFAIIAVVFALIRGH